MKLIVAFRNFANAPKNSYPLRVFETGRTNAWIQTSEKPKKKEKKKASLS
jgi:hypothetical protein